MVITLTDTIYGILGKPTKKVISKINKIKKRSPNKPYIILISKLEQLKQFNIKLTNKEEDIIKKLWPGPVSIILPCSSKKLEFLHLKSGGLAFRLPKNKELIEIISKTGPLVAPSANPEGLTPAKNITEAKKYFGDSVNYYLPSKRQPNNKPSTIIAINKEKVIVKRQGKKIIPSNLL